MLAVGAAHGVCFGLMRSVLAGEVAVPSCCTLTTWPSKMVKLPGVLRAEQMHADVMWLTWQGVDDCRWSSSAERCAALGGPSQR